MEKILVDHKGDTACGQDCEYDALLVDIRELIKGEPQRTMGDSVIDAVPPDWKQIRKFCLELCKKTHNLEVLIYLIQASLKIDGFSGLLSSTTLLQGVVEKYWDCLYPQIDPDDKDPLARINLLSTLESFPFLLKVRQSPILTAKLAGSVSLYSIEDANSAKPGDKEGDNKKKLVEAVFLSSSQEDLQHAHEVIENCENLFKQLSTLLGTQEYMSVTISPSFNDLIMLLESAKAQLSPYLDQSTPEEEDEEAMESDQAIAEGQANTVKKIKKPGIHSRAEALKAFDELEKYFVEHEPGSPIPLFIHRTRKLLDMDFIQLMQELAPDGVKQAEIVLGESFSDESEETSKETS